MKTCMRFCFYLFLFLLLYKRLACVDQGIIWFGQKYNGPLFLVMLVLLAWKNLSSFGEYLLDNFLLYFNFCLGCLDFKPNQNFFSWIVQCKLNIATVEDKIFTPHGFISLATCTTSILSWILGKSISKPKITHIYTKQCQSPRSKTHGDIISLKPMLQAYGTSSHFQLMIQAHLIRGTLGVMVWRAKKYVQ